MRRPRRGRRRIDTFDHGQPIWRPSLAPLAAVWLIGATLLMGVYVNPPHAILIDLPAPIPAQYRPGSDSRIQVLRIGVEPDGTPTFNAVRVSPRDLALMLNVASHLVWTPGIIFEPHPKALYHDALPILGEIKKAGLAG